MEGPVEALHFASSEVRQSRQAPSFTAFQASGIQPCGDPRRRSRRLPRSRGRRIAEEADTARAPPEKPAASCAGTSIGSLVRASARRPGRPGRSPSRDRCADLSSRRGPPAGSRRLPERRRDRQRSARARMRRKRTGHVPPGSTRRRMRGRSSVRGPSGRRPARRARLSRIPGPAKRRRTARPRRRPCSRERKRKAFGSHHGTFVSIVDGTGPAVQFRPPDQRARRSSSSSLNRTLTMYGCWPASSGRRWW